MTNFFFKGLDNILGFASLMTSVATAQLCYCSFNVATDNIKTNGPSCFSIFYLQKPAAAMVC